MNDIKVKKLRPDAILPSYANNDDTNAGIDFSAVENVYILPGDTTKISTGIALDFSCSDKKLFMKLESRSGLASKGIFVEGGIIDASYRGEILVILHNSTKGIYAVKKGDRVAQGIIHEINYFKVEEVTELSETNRGANGFGSSGI